MFTRQVFTPQFPRQVGASRIRRNPVYAALLERPSPSAHFSMAQLLAVACEALGEALLQKILQEPTNAVVMVLGAIIDDHARSETTRQKDLQVNLIANLIVQLCNLQGMGQAARYAAAENYFTVFGIEGEFKRALREALFDRQAILSRPMTIHNFH